MLLATPTPCIPPLTGLSEIAQVNKAVFPAEEAPRTSLDTTGSHEGLTLLIAYFQEQSGRAIRVVFHASDGRS